MRKFNGVIFYGDKVIGYGSFKSFGCMSDNSLCYELVERTMGAPVFDIHHNLMNLKDYWYSCGYSKVHGKRIRVFYLEGEN